jgi:hypothetical protein
VEWIAVMVAPLKCILMGLEMHGVVGVFVGKSAPPHGTICPAPIVAHMTNEAIHVHSARPICSTNSKKRAGGVDSGVICIPDAESFPLKGRDVMETRVEEGVKVLRGLQSRNE